jgi:twitching motility protein PilT
MSVASKSQRVPAGTTPAPNLSVVKKTDSEPARKIDMRYLVRALVKYGASDLHLRANRPPLYRINGKLIPAKMDVLTSEQVQEIVNGVLSQRQFEELERKLQVDLSFAVGDMGRFRCNAFYQKGSVCAAVRMIPFTVPKIDEIGMPSVLKELALRPRGLILITGATGSGKSTTLSAMIQHINETRPVHILTIEDPIEFIYRDTKATITQREVGLDTHTFKDALYAGLRQDPDVIMVGELRDWDTIQIALTAAETGHLVISTLHTRDARSSIERIIDVCPPEAKNQVRMQMASALAGVVSQQLLSRADGTGRIPACEVMINSPVIENYIRKNDVQKIPEAMLNSNSYYKMQTFNQDLQRLVKRKLVTLEDAMKVSPNPDDLRLSLNGMNGITAESPEDDVPVLQTS